MLGHNDITTDTRSTMKVYASRDYKDDKYRSTNYVAVNAPEYLPTTPQNDEYTEQVVPANYFANSNFPVTQDVVKSTHDVGLPLMAGTYCPVRFNKGAEFLLVYPSGKLEDGYLIFLRDYEKDKSGERIEEVSDGCNQNAG